MMQVRSDRTVDGVEYKVGAKFRVIRGGARLSGFKPIAPYTQQGWRQDLAVGDVIECTGYGPGWGSDPGYGIGFTSEQSLAEHVNAVDFWPSAGGPFSFRPAPGYLESVEETGAVSAEKEDDTHDE